MKKILILALSVVLVLVTGCTTPSGNPAPVTATPTPTYTVPPDALPMSGSISLGNATHQITASIDSFEVTSNAEPGTHTVTIYVNAKNTGIDPIMYTWFSKLTDLNGNAYGGNGVSHSGNGARSPDDLPEHVRSCTGLCYR